jgi:cubilin
MLMLSFMKFKLEESAGCQHDMVLVLDGLTVSAPHLGRYCGPTRPPNVNTTHNSAVVLFRSDASVNMDGFELRWQSAEPVCGGRLSGADHGTISSPSYPGVYPNSRDCSWTISVSPGSTIQFHFGLIALEDGGPNCTKDYLQIADGLSSLSGRVFTDVLRHAESSSVDDIGTVRVRTISLG